MPNEEGLYSKDEWNGLLTDKQNEVRNRQQTQAELAVAKTELGSLNERIKALEKAPKEEVIENGDDMVTKKELIAQLKQQRKEMTDGYEADKKNDKDNTTKKQKEAAVDKSFANAKKSMTEEKMGKGLDFDSVWEGAKRFLAIKSNASYKAVITSADNPGEKAYEIGLLDPIIAKRVALDKKNFPDQIRTPKIGLDTTEVPSNYFSQERVKGMSRAEIEANIKSIRESQKTWNKKK